MDTLKPIAQIGGKYLKYIKIQNSYGDVLCENYCLTNDTGDTGINNVIIYGNSDFIPCCVRIYTTDKNISAYYGKDLTVEIIRTMMDGEVAPLL